MEVLRKHFTKEFQMKINTKKPFSIAIRKMYELEETLSKNADVTKY